MISMNIIRAEPPRSSNWHDSLFNCFSQILPSCFISFLCPCILLGQISEAVHFAPCFCICTAYSTLSFMALTLLFLSYQGIFLVWGIIATLLFVIRVHVRRYNHLKIETLPDMAAVCCCSWCVISQVSSTNTQHSHCASLFLDGTPCLSISLQI
jgi:Cys-rich protein (TIGR01571 family)